MIAPKLRHRQAIDGIVACIDRNGLFVVFTPNGALVVNRKVDMN